ncbi:hypothetical protein GIJ48_04650 [Escherichia coli]|nr:hypothetical protein [Escherichia coli]
MKGYVVASLLMMTCFGSVAENNKDTAPFGFKWQASVDEVKESISGNYIIVSEEVSCPISKLKLIKANEEHTGSWVYELGFFTPRSGDKFIGLNEVSYSKSSKDKKAIDEDFKNVRAELTSRYKEKDNEYNTSDEMSFTYNSPYVTGLLAYEDGYAGWQVTTIVLNTPTLDRKEWAEVYDKAKSECFKQ